MKEFKLTLQEKAMLTRQEAKFPVKSFVTNQIGWTEYRLLSMFLLIGYLEGPVLFKTYDMDYYRSLLDKKEEEKTDVPFRLLNPELLPYNIMKKNNRERREEFERKLQEDMETMKI